MKKISALILAAVLIGISLNAQPLKVTLVRADDKQKVDVMIDGKLFTSYQYPSNMEKPYLFPVFAPMVQ